MRASLYGQLDTETRLPFTLDERNKIRKLKVRIERATAKWKAAKSPPCSRDANKAAAKVKRLKKKIMNLRLGLSAAISSERIATRDLKQANKSMKKCKVTVAGHWNEAIAAKRALKGAAGAARAHAKSRMKLKREEEKQKRKNLAKKAKWQQKGRRKAVARKTQEIIAMKPKPKPRRRPPPTRLLPKVPKARQQRRRRRRPHSPIDLSSVNRTRVLLEARNLLTAMETLGPIRRAKHGIKQTDSYTKSQVDKIVLASRDAYEQARSRKSRPEIQEQHRHGLTLAIGAQKYMKESGVQQLNVRASYTSSHSYEQLDQAMTGLQRMPNDSTMQEAVSYWSDALNMAMLPTGPKASPLISSSSPKENPLPFQEKKRSAQDIIDAMLYDPRLYSRIKVFPYATVIPGGVGVPLRSNARDMLEELFEIPLDRLLPHKQVINNILQTIYAQQE